MILNHSHHDVAGRHKALLDGFSDVEEFAC